SPASGGCDCIRVPRDCRAACWRRQGSWLGLLRVEFERNEAGRVFSVVDERVHGTAGQPVDLTGSAADRAIGGAGLDPELKTGDRHDQLGNGVELLIDLRRGRDGDHPYAPLVRGDELSPL